MSVPRAQLHRLPRKSRNREFLITRASIVVGSAEDCDLQLTDDPRISRHHSEILGEEDHWFVRDLDSSQGTYLNDTRIVRSPLRRGDRIRVGGATLHFHWPQPQTAPRLQWQSPDAHETILEVIDLSAGRITVGRSSENQLSFPDANDVSRCHALVLFEGGAWWVQDLKSRNGTFVNGQRVQRQRLCEGDEVRFSQEVFRFTTGSAPPSPSSEKTAQEQVLESPVTARFVATAGIRTLGDVTPAQCRPGFLGLNHPGRRRAAWAAGGFVVGFGLGAAWSRLVAGRFIAVAAEGKWSPLLVSGLLGGVAGFILMALPEITKRLLLDHYFRLRALLLRSAAHRRMRSVYRRLTERTQSDGQDWTALSDMVGLYLLQNKLPEAHEVIGTLGEASHACPSLHNNCGVALARSHFPSRAVEEFTSALGLDSERSVYHANLGRICFKLNQVGKAVELLERAVTLAPQDAGCKVSLGMAYLHTGRLREAESLFRSALDLEPAASDAANNRAVVRHLENDAEASRQMLKAALHTAPGHTAAHANLGVEHLFKGESSYALRELTKALHLSPDLFLIRNNLSVALYVSRSEIEAEKELNAASKANPAPVDCLYNLGTLHWLQGHTDVAATYLSRAVQRQPRDAASLINLGCVLFQAGNVKRAVQLFEGALEHEPENPAALTNLGLCLILLGRVRDAVPIIKKSAAIQPDHPVTRFNLAYAEHLLGDAEAAVRAYELLIASEGDLPEVYVNLGLCYYFLGVNLTLAIQSLTRAADLAPNLHTLPLSLGRVYCEAGDLTRALPWLEQALKDEPLNPDTYRNLGLVYYQTSQMDKAVQTFLRGVRLSPHEAMDHNNLALAYAKKKKHEEAIYHFKRALELQPDDVSIRSNLGLCYYLIGKVDLALTQWHETLRISPKYASEREAVLHAEFDEARLGYAPLDWQARSVYIQPVGMGLRYQLLPSDENEWCEIELTDPDLVQSASFLRRARRYAEALKSLYV